MNQSIELVIEAIELIEEADDVFRIFSGSVSDKEILDYENELDIVIDPGYRLFISQYGAGSFGYLEIPGVLSEHKKNESDPRDSKCLTEKFRKKSNFSPDLYIVGSIGDGCEWVLKSLSTFETNTTFSPVYSWDMGVDYTTHKLDAEYSSFGEYLLKNVINAINFSREID